jgi:ABC-2 type transport system permease protein
VRHTFQSRRLVRCARSGGLWGALGLVFLLASSYGYQAAYSTATARKVAAAALSSTTSFQFLLGSPHDLESAAGFTAWRAGGILAIVFAIWGLFLATSLLRGEEERGRLEIEASGSTTLVGVTISSLSSSLVGWLALMLVVSSAGLVMSTSHALGVSTAGGLEVGVILGSSGLFFLGVGALTSQLALSRRSANMMGAGVLGISVLLRGIAGVVPAWSFLSFLSPLGWIDRSRALTESRILFAVPVLVGGLVLLAAAVAISRNRDLGSAALRTRSVHDRHRRVTGVIWSTLSLSGGVDLAWIGAFALMGVVFGVSAKSASKLTSSSSIQQVLSRLGVISVGPSAYLGIAGFSLALFGLIVAAVSATATGREELEGRAEILLALPISRARWLLGRAGSGLGVLLAACAAATLTMYLSVTATGVHLAATMLVTTTLAMFAPGAALLGLATLAHGIHPSLTRLVAYGLITASLLVTMVVAVIKLNHLFADLTLLGHAGYPPGSPLKVIGFSVLLALTAAGGAAGAVLFARRDLVQRG